MAQEQGQEQGPVGSKEIVSIDWEIAEDWGIVGGLAVVEEGIEEHRCGRSTTRKEDTECRTADCFSSVQDKWMEEEDEVAVQDSQN